MLSHFIGKGVCLQINYFFRYQSLNSNRCPVCMERFSPILDTGRSVPKRLAGNDKENPRQRAGDPPIGPQLLKYNYWVSESRYEFLG